jgi:branched-chain amino acid transport system ATP-binding protein
MNAAVAASGNNAMLRLEGVSAGYAGFQALFNVSLEVRAGESVAVIGPNGAGKTTLLRTISKLISATAGDILMEGRSLKEVPAHEVIARGIAQVPEGRRLFARLTVDENLRMGAFLPAARPLHGERLQFVYSLFPRLQERRTQIAGTLSGGEQQMCAIGRALMSGPKLLQSIFELVKRICGEGYTVLIVEQNIRQVLKVVDRAYLLETGRIKSSGPSAELLASNELRKAYLGV